MDVLEELSGLHYISIKGQVQPSCSCFYFSSRLQKTPATISRNWLEQNLAMESKLTSSCSWQRHPVLGKPALEKKKKLKVCKYIFAAYRLPLTNYHLPLTTYPLPLNTKHLPLTTKHLQPTTYHLPLTNYRWLITSYHLPVTTYNLWSFIIYHLGFFLPFFIERFDDGRPPNVLKVCW